MPARLHVIDPIIQPQRLFAIVTTLPHPERQLVALGEHHGTPALLIHRGSDAEPILDEVIDLLDTGERLPCLRQWLNLWGHRAAPLGKFVKWRWHYAGHQRNIVVRSQDDIPFGAWPDTA